MSVRDEVVLITGGSAGIGLAAARRFATAGARVVLVARDAARLEAAAETVGDLARGVPADVTQPEDVQALVRDVADHEGRVDVLVNSAGAFEVGPVEALGEATAARLMEVNYLGAVRTLHATLPLLRRGRRRSIVNVASLAAKLPLPYMAAYAGSKFALAAYTHVLRQELRPDGFHVGLLMPGPVDTEMIEGKVRTRFYPLPPGVRLQTPDEAADALYGMVLRRRAEAMLPSRLAPVARLASAFPRIVDAAYRRLVTANAERGAA